MIMLSVLAKKYGFPKYVIGKDEKAAKPTEGGEDEYQYYVDFDEKAKGKDGKPIIQLPVPKEDSRYARWELSRKNIKDILSHWDQVAVWVPAGKKRKDTTVANRTTPSKPLAEWLDKNSDKKNTNVLYHGVGQDYPGYQALKETYLNIDIYDPYFDHYDRLTKDKELTDKGAEVEKKWGLKVDVKRTRAKPEERSDMGKHTNKGKLEFGHVHSHYTLNVVTKAKGKEILEHIYKLLSDTGIAIISVRRDEAVSKGMQISPKELEKIAERRASRKQKPKAEGFLTKVQGYIGTRTEIESKLREVLEKEVNPKLKAHGGVCELVAVEDNGVISIRFGGSCEGCSGCGSSMIRDITPVIKKAVPEVKKILLSL